MLTTPDLWPSHEWTVKLIITFETLVYLIIAAVVVGIWLWLWNRDPKKSNSESKT